MMHHRCDLREQPIVRRRINRQNGLWQFKLRGFKSAPAPRDDRTHACRLHRIHDDASETKRVASKDAPEPEVDWRLSRSEKLLEFRWWLPLLQTIEKPVPGHGRRIGPIRRPWNDRFAIGMERGNRFAVGMSEMPVTSPAWQIVTSCPAARSPFPSATYGCTSPLVPIVRMSMFIDDP